MRAYKVVIVAMMVLGLVACKSNSVAVPPQQHPPPSMATVSPSPARVDVPFAGSPAEKVLAQVPTRGQGAYSGQLNAYFACTGGGSMEIALGSLVSYTEPCASGTVSRGREVYHVGSAASVLLNVRGNGVPQWSFILTVS